MCFYRKEMWLVCHTGRGSGAEQLAGMSWGTPVGVRCCIFYKTFFVDETVIGRHRSFKSNTSRAW